MLKIDKILRQVNKPARYTGGEWNSIVKDWEQTSLKWALAFPDTYEIGMSNMAIPILYSIINKRSDALAERVYAPWLDMVQAMRQAAIPLFSLESKKPLNKFDIIGFSLGYELCYTTVLEMLYLGNIPVLAENRGEEHPLVIAGGSCVMNPEPMADFIDLFVIGEGEEILDKLLDKLLLGKKTGASRYELLIELGKLPGIYVPQFYQPSYRENGIFEKITPLVPGVNQVIQRNIIAKLPEPVTRPVMPFIEAVHDRGMVEIQRGCTRGCRFCQAGIIYRPIRVRPQEEVVNAVGDLMSNCGYNDVSLLSLSSSDYPQLDTLVSDLLKRYGKQNLNLSLPSLRIDNFSLELMDLLSGGKRPGLTFAPEAGSDRLRRVINKGITNEEIINTAAAAFQRGWMGLKLYFMLGLPTETTADIEGIAQLVATISQMSRTFGSRKAQLRTSFSTFVPKPHTPFQWLPQADEQTINERQEMLRQILPHKGIKLSWSDAKTSLLEAVFSRGDRRLGKVIYYAWKHGALMDTWSEHFHWEIWEQALDSEGLDPHFYAGRMRPMDEALPWGHIQSGVNLQFLKKEYERAMQETGTADCRTHRCNRCGLEKLKLCHPVKN